AATWPVPHDEWRAEPLRQPLSHQARDDVTCAAGGKADNDAHRPRRIGLRPSKARHGWQRGSASGQMQKFSAGKFHFDPSLVKGSDEHFCTPVTYVTGSIAVFELLVFESAPIRPHRSVIDEEVIHGRVCQIYKRRSDVARSVIDGRANHGLPQRSAF